MQTIRVFVARAVADAFRPAASAAAAAAPAHACRAPRTGPLCQQLSRSAAASTSRAVPGEAVNRIHTHTCLCVCVLSAARDPAPLPSRSREGRRPPCCLHRLPAAGS